MGLARTPMFIRTSVLLAVLALPMLVGCSNERKSECEQFLSAMKPLDELKPSADTVDRIRDAVSQIQFKDQPLGIYAKNFDSTLEVLSNTLKVKPDPVEYDGTDSVIATNLRVARVDRDDTVRYCAQ